MVNQFYIINFQEIKSRKNYQIILEYGELNLLDFYQKVKKQSRTIPEIQIKSIIYQIASGLSYMHSQGYFHRDLKPENILITENGIIKIVDLGQVTTLQPTNRMNHTEYVSTRWYRAPEQILSKGYNKEIDIWALGCILGELYLLEPIFPGNSDIDQLSKFQQLIGNQNFELQSNETSEYIYIPSSIQNNQSDINIAEKISPYAYDLLLKMLTVDPQQRISAQDILEHNWLSKNYQFLPKQLMLENNESQFMIEQSPFLKKEKERKIENTKVKESKINQPIKEITLNEEKIKQESIKYQIIENAPIKYEIINQWSQKSKERFPIQEEEIIKKQSQNEEDEDYQMEYVPSGMNNNLSQQRSKKSNLKSTINAIPKLSPHKLEPEKQVLELPQFVHSKQNSQAKLQVEEDYKKIQKPNFFSKPMLLKKN